MQIKETITGSEPVSTSDVKNYLNVDFTTNDTLIASLITGIREEIELFTGLALVAKTVEYFDETIPTKPVKLPFPEHLSIEELKINGEVSTSYVKTGLSQFIVTLTATTTETSLINDAGFYIKYKCTGTCPSGIKLEILKAIDEKYRNRGDTFEGAISDLSENSYANLAKYCLM